MRSPRRGLGRRQQRHRPPARQRRRPVNQVAHHIIHNGGKRLRPSLRVCRARAPVPRPELIARPRRSSSSSIRHAAPRRRRRRPASGAASRRPTPCSATSERARRLLYSRAFQMMVEPAAPRSSTCSRTRPTRSPRARSRSSRTATTRYVGSRLHGGHLPQDRQAVRSGTRLGATRGSERRSSRRS